MIAVGLENNVKFGDEPLTQCVKFCVSLRGSPLVFRNQAVSELCQNPICFGRWGYAIAEKQLYASHYFETALDLSFCLRGSSDSNQPGFFLVMAMGSE